MAETRLQVKISADASEAITAFRSASEGLKGMGAASEDVAAQSEKVAAALAKMDAAVDNPKRLGTNAAIAAMKVQDLKEALTAAGMVGDKVPTAIAAAMKKAETSIAAAGTRAAQFKDQLGDMKTKGDQAALGFESLAGAAGSLDGMLGKLKDSGGESAGRIADLGFKVMAIGAAFETGKALGDKFAATLKELTGFDIKNVGQGLVNLGFDLKEAGEGFNQLPPKVNPAIKAIQAYNQQLEASEAWMAKAVPGFKNYGDTVSDATKKFEGIGNSLDVMTRKGQSLDDIVKVNREAILKWREETEKADVAFTKLPLSVQQAIAAAEASKKADDDAAKAKKDLADAAKKAADDQIAAAKKVLEEAKKAAEEAAKPLLKQVETQQKVGAAGKKMAAELEEATKAGAAAFKLMASENEASIQHQIDDMKAFGIEVPEELLRAAAAAKAYRDALKDMPPAPVPPAHVDAPKKVADALADATEKVNGFTAAGYKAEMGGQSVAETYGRIKSELVDLRGATESFTEFLPTSTKGLRDFAAAVEGPIDSMGKLAQQFTFLSDNFASSASIWVEPLITDLEAGRIGIDKFRAALESMKGAVGMMSAWSFASVADYQNMLSQMAAAEQEYFDRSRKQAEKAIQDLQRQAIEAREARYQADVAENQNGMGDSTGGAMGSSSSGGNSIGHRTAGMTPQTVGTAIKLKLGR